jgi:ribosomal protein S27AE
LGRVASSCWGKVYYFECTINGVAGGGAGCPKCGGQGKPIGENRYLCGQCGTEFYACPVCGATFFSPQQLGGHMKYHKREQERGRDAVLDTLQEIVNRLDMLEDRLDRIEKILNSLATQPRLETPQKTGESELPSFARDNPWLKILSSR